MTFTDETGIAAAERLGVRLTHPDRIVYPDTSITKAQLVAYYEAVAPRMLPHLINRPLSLVRAPQGQSDHGFFQKHASEGFPDEFKPIPIVENDGDKADYLYVTGLEGVVAGVQMNSLEFHIWGSRIDSLEKPDRLVFDIDPDEGLDFAAVRSAAADIRDGLADLGLKSFAMVSGGKGVHVIVPLRRRLQWPAAKDFCHGFAERLATDEPKRFTANIRKASRTGRLFVDYLRNERGSTAIAPFSTRNRPGAPCAVPVSWAELAKLSAANLFSLDQAAAHAAGPDPWPDYFNLNQSIKKSVIEAFGGDKV